MKRVGAWAAIVGVVVGTVLLWRPLDAVAAEVTSLTFDNLACKVSILDTADHDPSALPRVQSGIARGRCTFDPARGVNAGTNSSLYLSLWLVPKATTNTGHSSCVDKDGTYSGGYNGSNSDMQAVSFPIDSYQYGGAGTYGSGQITWSGAYNIAPSISTFCYGDGIEIGGGNPTSGSGFTVSWAKLRAPQAGTTTRKELEAATCTGVVEQYYTFDQTGCASAARTSFVVAYGEPGDTPASVSWPADFFAGVEPPVQTDGLGQVPRVYCGRTMRAVGGGQWFADLEAVIMNPRAGTTDSAGFWSFSWQVSTVPGRNPTVAIPTSYTGVKVATYHVRRSLDGGQLGSLDWMTEENGEWVEDGGSPSLWRWATHGLDGSDFTGHEDYFDFVEGEDGYVFFDSEDVRWGPEDVNEAPWVSVEATCSVPVAPEYPDLGEDNETGVESGPSDPGPVGGGEDPETPGEDGGECESPDGWSLLNPFAWGGTLFCNGLKAMLSLLKDLANALLSLGDLLIELFVPDDLDVISEGLLDDWTGRIPFSWVASMGDIGPSLVSGVNASQSCAPVGTGYMQWDPCAGGTVVQTWRPIVRGILSLCIWVTLGSRILRAAPWAKGRDGGELG